MNKVSSLSLDHKRLGFVLLFVFTPIAQAQTIEDSVLSEQIVSSEKISPNMIIRVKHDAQIPVVEQLKKQQYLAKEQSNEIKKQTLESTAASDYEIKRTTDSSKLFNQEHKVYIPNKTIHTPENIIFEGDINFQNNGNIKGSGTATVTTTKK